MRLLYAFLGGALVGAASAILFAPERGEELRDQIRDILVRKGIIKDSEEQQIIDQIVAEIEAEK